MKKWYRDDRPMAEKMDALLKRLCREFGWKTKIFAALSGKVLYRTLKKEEKRLAKGWAYEPYTCYEKNAPIRALERANRLRHLVPDFQKATRKLSPNFRRSTANALDPKHY
jgi:hypothetical protein